MKPVRPRVLVAQIALLLLPATAALAEPPTLAVLDFGIVDTSREPRDQSADHARRLAEFRAFVMTEFEKRGIYQVVDLDPIRPSIDAAVKLENLHACNGCDIELGRKAGADRVMVAWIKKVSTLVMSTETEIRDTATGKPVVHKSLDFRGDNDVAWRRLSRYLVERFEELPEEKR